MTPKVVRIPILDSLRAFAAISVCLYHFVCTTTGFISTEWVLKLFSVGQYGVQLFFVISGFVIPWSMNNAGYKFNNLFSFSLKRIIRLEPPYLFSVATALLILSGREIFLGAPNSHITVGALQIALHLGYLIPFFSAYHWLSPVYWTLAIEFQYYFLMALLFVPLVSNNLFLRLFIYFVLLALSFLGGDGFVFYWLPFFLLGILLFLKTARLIQSSEYLCVSTLILVLCFYKYPLFSVLYSIVPVFCVLFAKNVEIYGVRYVGRFSYSLYLFHPLIGASFINLLSHHFFSSFSKVVVILTGLTVTLIFSWVAFVLVENPSKKLASSIKYH